MIKEKELVGARQSSPGPPSFFSRCSQCYAPRGAPVEPRGALGGALGAEIGPVGVGDAAAPGAGVGALRRRAAGAGRRRARRTATAPRILRPASLRCFRRERMVQVRRGSPARASASGRDAGARLPAAVLRGPRPTSVEVGDVPSVSVINAGCVCGRVLLGRWRGPAAGTLSDWSATHARCSSSDRQLAPR